MKRYVPFIALLLFTGSESFITQDCFDAAGQRETLYCLVFAAVAIFLSTLFFFYFYFRYDHSGRQAWEELFASPSSLPGAGIVLLILAAGFVLRLWTIWSPDGGLPWDAAYKGLDGIAIREFGERPIYLDWNAGREAMVAYLVAASQSLFGYSVFSVRIVMALAGCLTLPFFYLLSKNIFGRYFALLSTFLLAFSRWHIIHSRYSVRVVLFPLFELVTLYLVLRALKSGKSAWMILAGIIGGLGFYTYIAYRIFPVILLAFILDQTIRTKLRLQWKGIVFGLLLSAAIVAPLAIYSIDHAERFRNRMERTAVWNEPGNVATPVMRVLESTKATLAMFTFKGDSIAKHNVDGKQMLSSFVTGFFLLGILITLVNIRKPFAMFLLVYLLLSLLPGFLTVQAPQSSRTLGSVIPATFLVTVGLISALRIVRTTVSGLARPVLIIVLCGCAFTGVNDSLLRYPEMLDALSPSDSSTYGTDRDQYEIAQFLNQLGPAYDVYLSPQLFFHSTIEYLTYGKTPHKLYSQYTNLNQTPGKNKIALVVMMPNTMNLWWLRDDDQRNFLKWWSDYYGIKSENMRAVILRTYISYPRMSETSDLRLQYILQTRHPRSKVLNFGRFLVVLVGQTIAMNGGPTN